MRVGRIGEERRGEEGDARYASNELRRGLLLCDGRAGGVCGAGAAPADADAARRSVGGVRKESR